MSLVTMDLGVAADHLKCRVCLSPDTNANFIQLQGSTAEMFTEVIGVELTIDAVKTESAICQNCFSKLENSYDFKAEGIRAHREYFEIQRQLASSQRETNDTAQAADDVELPEPEAEAIEPQSRVKQEPPVEFMLILPRPTIDRSAEEGSNRKWVESVQLTKFDVKWSSELTPFQTFLTCKRCRLIVKSQRGLTKHLKTCSEMNGGRFECDICGERVQNKSRLGQHMRKHSNERNFRCKKCGNGFKSKGDLTTHKKTHKKSITCTDCQKKFSAIRYLKFHQMQHRHGIYATAKEETFDCSTCDKTFSTPHYLKIHQRHVHDENKVKCKTCDKVFKNRASMLYHSRSHIKVECTICHILVSRHWMTFHVRSHSNRFDCELCNHSTNTKGNLKDHIERKHLLMKLVEDSKREDFRDVELLEKLQLKYGSSATSAGKKFRCDKCEKSFATPRSLNNHKWKVHPEKLFDCQLCTKAYKTKAYLNRHKDKVHAKMSIK